MRKRILLSIALAIPSLTLVTGLAWAFIDEVQSLRAELITWETSNVTNFDNVINGLDELSGTVFKDVKEQDWFASYVTSLADWGVVSGFRDTKGQSTGEYRPSQNVTIAEALKMAMKAADMDTNTCPITPKRSVGNHWASRYVSCAEQNLVRLFDPTRSLNIDRPATRAEILTLVHDAFGDHVAPIFSSYKDTAGHTLEPDIAFATITGLVSGDNDAQGKATGTFRPDSSINRAEVAKIIYQRLKIDARQKMATKEITPGT